VPVLVVSAAIAALMVFTSSAGAVSAESAPPPVPCGESSKGVLTAAITPRALGQPTSLGWNGTDGTGCVVEGMAAAVGADTQASASWRQIRNRASGKCLDNALENSAKLQIWSCVKIGDPTFEGFEQMWRVEAFIGPEYRFRNRNTDLCAIAISTNATVGHCGSSGNADRWFIIHQKQGASGWYQVLRNLFGLCLSASGSANGAAVQQLPCDLTFANASQQWLLGENLPFTGGITVPDVVGFSHAAAVSALTAAGLKADSPTRINDCSSPGDVIVQSPRAGSIMSPGLVHISVSTCDGGDPR
jgi:hypothetical protein